MRLNQFSLSAVAVMVAMLAVAQARPITDGATDLANETGEVPGQLGGSSTTNILEIDSAVDKATEVLSNSGATDTIKGAVDGVRSASVADTALHTVRNAGSDSSLRRRNGPGAPGAVGVAAGGPGGVQAVAVTAKTNTDEENENEEEEEESEEESEGLRRRAEQPEETDEDEEDEEEGQAAPKSKRADDDEEDENEEEPEEEDEDEEEEDSPSEDAESSG